MTAEEMCRKEYIYRYISNLIEDSMNSLGVWDSQFDQACIEGVVDDLRNTACDLRHQADAQEIIDYLRANKNLEEKAK